AWLTDRRFLLWPALLLGLGFASGLSLSGHSAVDAGSSWRSELADWAHLSAAAIWIGGLVQLAFVVWPKAPELRRTAFLRFSRLASGLIAVVLGAGVYLINHSLGAMPQGAEENLLRYAREWRERGVRAWAEGWWETSVTVGDRISRIIGAAPGTTVMHQNVAVAQAVVLSCFEFEPPRN